MRAAVMAGAKPAVCNSQQFKQSYADLVEWRRESQLPVVYHPDYNITFGGLEKLHPFDSCKFKKVGCNIEYYNDVLDAASNFHKHKRTSAHVVNACRDVPG